jgi:WD40 repeat protein
VVRKGSIFNLKSEDCIDILLIKSKDNYMFTIEKHKMDFFTVSTFKKSDSWDYFFPRAITGCGKNREGSKICVWDSSSTLSLFNFLKNVDKRQKSQVAPSHRRQDQIQCLDVHNDQIVTCSLDRELRVWDMDGKFIKKYDLTSFTNEALICMKMTQSGMLFLGSKDLNVYLVDVLKGKLCVVYEGHWSRVNLISQVLDKDILITVSESNIKVWDLEYDECIKNMNEHKSQVIYCESSQTNQRNIVTISQDYEYKEWSYTTAVVEKAEILKLPEGSHLVAADLSPENLGFFALDSH